MADTRLARPWLRAQTLDPHQPHQSPHALAVDPHTLSRQQRHHPARSQKGPAQKQRVDPPHQGQIVVIRRTAQPDIRQIAQPPASRLVARSKAGDDPGRASLDGPGRSLAEPRREKIVLDRQLSDLRM